MPEGELTGPWRELVDRVRETAEPSPGRSPGGSTPRRPAPGRGAPGAGRLP
ncbi:hypothetical protein [Agromyces protaetiae]|uniref:hypothetical protein n=1 Tax=Agromyces protaetiae TaxID=2509455 RepID=UPI001AA067FD|nr:hypothetical protein [Agromyces protaetiae]